MKEVSDTSSRAQFPRIFRNLSCAYYIKLDCEGARFFEAGSMFLNITKHHWILRKEDVLPRKPKMLYHIRP